MLVEELVLVVVIDVLVELLVEVLVVVLVLVVSPRLHNQLFPEYRHHANCFVSKYSSPTSGSVGGVADTNIFPFMFVICVSDIGYTVVLVLVLVEVLILVLVD